MGDIGALQPARAALLDEMSALAAICALVAKASEIADLYAWDSYATLLDRVHEEASNHLNDKALEALGDPQTSDGDR